MNEDKKQNPNRRFVGKVKSYQGNYGTYQKIHIDNPNSENADGSANKYHKGSLLWLDKETGKLFVVKQFSVKNVSESAKQNGFSNSIAIDLDSQYDVEEKQ